MSQQQPETMTGPVLTIKERQKKADAELDNAVKNTSAAVVEQEIKDDLQRNERDALRYLGALLKETPGLDRQEEAEIRENSFQSIIMALRAVHKGIINPPPASKSFLTMISYDINTSAHATTFYQLITRYLTNDIENAAEAGFIQQQFHRLLSLSDLDPAQRLAETLLKTAVRHRPGGMDDAQIKTNFVDVLTTIRVARQKHVEEQNLREAKVRGPTSQEKVDYKTFRDRLEQKLDYLKTQDQTIYDHVSRRYWELKKYNPEDPNVRNEWIKLLTDPNYFGLTQEDAERYIYLRAVATGMQAVDGGYDPRLAAYNITPDDFAPLRASIIEDNFGGSSIQTEEEATRRQVYFMAGKGPDGKPIVVLTDYGRKKIVRTMYETVNKLLGKISAAVDVEWEQVFDPLYEGAIQRAIQNNLFAVLNVPDIDNLIRGETEKLIAGGITGGQLEHAKSEAVIGFKDYIKKISGEFYNEISTRRNYHAIRKGIIRGTINPEQILGFVKNFPASSKEALMKGYHAILFELALAEFEEDMQYKIAMNGNQLDANTLASYFTETERLDTKDLKRIREKLWDKIQRLKNDPALKAEMAKPENALLKHEMEQLFEVEQWEIDRVLILAPGFSMVDSMRVHEIMAQSGRRMDFKGIFQFAQHISMWAKWKIGRGRADDNTGGFKVESLFKIVIQMKEDKRSFWEKLTAEGWIPNDIFVETGEGLKKDLVDLVTNLEDQINQLEGEFGDDFETTFNEALRYFNLLGFYSRAGWRIDGLKSWISENFPAGKEAEKKRLMDQLEKTGWQAGQMIPVDYQEALDRVDTEEFRYDYLRRNIGAASCWFFDAGRIDDEIKDYVLKILWEDPKLRKGRTGADYKHGWSEDEQKNLFKSYHAGKNFNVPIVEAILIDEHGHEEVENMPVEEFIDAKKIVYKGMNFRAVMERTPLDFLINMNQLEPELNKVIKREARKGPGGEPLPGMFKPMTAWEYYFATPEELQAAGHTVLSEAEQKVRNDFRLRINKRWGKKNTDHIKRIARFWHDLYNQDEYKDEKKTYDTEKAQRDMYDVMTLALAKVKLRRDQRMERKHFVLNKEGTDFENHKEKIIYNLLLGVVNTDDAEEEGLITYLKRQQELFGNLKGQANHLGNHGFFYQMAKVWDYEQGAMFPTTNDLRQEIIFHNIGEKDGEDIFHRLWGDLVGWNKTVDQLMGLDDLLLNASTTHKMDDIYKLHEAIDGLQGMISLKGSQKLNYILATVIARYFYLDYRSRFPYPLKALTALQAFGKQSLSVLHTDITGMSWGELDLYNYARHLEHTGALAKKGLWSMEMLLNTMNAELEDYMLRSGIPAAVMLISILLMAAVATKILKDQEIFISGQGKK